MEEYLLANRITGGLLPYTNFVLGITTEITPEDAHEAILHLKSALEMLPDGKQVSHNMGLEVFEKTIPGAAALVAARREIALNRKKQPAEVDGGVDPVDRFYSALDRVLSVRKSAFQEDRQRAMDDFLGLLRQMLQG